MLIQTPCKKNISAVIVTFFPDSSFPERVSRIARQVDQVVIVDNNSNKKIQRVLEGIKNSYVKVHLIRNDKNVGVATALNIGFRWARDRHYAWALTFDQDTVVEEFMVPKLIQAHKLFRDKDKIAVIGSNRIDPNSQRIMVSKKGPDVFLREEKTLISSGSLMSIDVFNKIGPFRDEFFIDSVDHEYCLRARAKGYKNLIVLEPLMKHTIGQGEVHFIIGKKIQASNHAPFRWYFITRNTLILAKEYFIKNFCWSIWSLARFIAGIGVMIIYEKKRFKKLKFIYLGFIDFITGNVKRNNLVLKDKT